MRLRQNFAAPLAFIFFGVICAGAAIWAATVIEQRSQSAVRYALETDGFGWASVTTDGLLVRLTGEAPSEAQRFRAISIAGNTVDPARVIDAMEVRDAAALEPPKFTVEILRNGDGISLIGVVPASTDREAIIAGLELLAGAGKVTDLLEAAEYPVPDNWDIALTYGLDALRQVTRSKISIAADRVAITAITDSAEEKQRLETRLSRTVPSPLTLTMDISAPRPVITPFTLRFVMDADGPRFDACSANNDAAQRTILAAATDAGVEDQPDCTIGLGVPTPDWGDAASRAIRALAELGAGSITFSDADISLIAAETVSERDFDRVVGELESNLPEVFSLTAVLTPRAESTDAPDGPPEFSATLSVEGQVQLRGRLTDERTRNAVNSFARARFGDDAVYTAARLDPELPDGWPIRVLAALEALSELESGAVTVLPDLVQINGVTGSTGTNAAIARILSDKLGAAAEFDITVRYDKKLDPLLGLPTADECVSEINAILNISKITFDPGSSNISADAGETLDKIAERMRDCTEFPMEIAGHTDSQGREEMNLSLSRDRAQSVLAALMQRRVVTSNLVAEGYGETLPIADNDTEDGREANRRIEFTLISTDEEVPDAGAAEPEAGQSSEAEAGESESGDADGAPPVSDADAEQGSDNSDN